MAVRKRGAINTEQRKYIILMVGGFAYIQSLKCFRELFNIHKNDAPHERQQPEGTETMSLFDGHTRVVLTTQKQTVTREVHREASLLGNGKKGKKEGRKKGRKEIGYSFYSSDSSSSRVPHTNSKS